MTDQPALKPMRTSSVGGLLLGLWALAPFAVVVFCALRRRAGIDVVWDGYGIALLVVLGITLSAVAGLLRIAAALRRSAGYRRASDLVGGAACLVLAAGLLILGFVWLATGMGTETGGPALIFVSLMLALPFAFVAARQAGSLARGLAGDGTAHAWATPSGMAVLVLGPPLLAVAGLLSLAPPPHRSSSLEHCVYRVRRLATLLVDQYALRGFPPYHGKNFVLAVIAEGLVNPEDPEGRELLFCPPTGDGRGRHRTRRPTRA